MERVDLEANMLAEYARAAHLPKDALDEQIRDLCGELAAADNNSRDGAENETADQTEARDLERHDEAEAKQLRSIRAGSLHNSRFYCQKTGSLPMARPMSTVG